VRRLAIGDRKLCSRKPSAASSSTRSKPSRSARLAALA
jgi:hypothetical protein